jgi:hypothetical protein
MSFTSSSLLRAFGSPPLASFVAEAGAPKEAKGGDPKALKSDEEVKDMKKAIVEAEEAKNRDPEMGEDEAAAKMKEDIDKLAAAADRKKAKAELKKAKADLKEALTVEKPTEN